MRSLPLALLLLAGACSSPRPIEERDRIRLDRRCADAIVQMKERDPGLEEWFGSRSYGYAIFPEVGKAGLVVGGAHGRGQVYERDDLIGYATLTQGTVGLQFGAQGYHEVVFFKDEAALSQFRRGNFELSAQASAIAVTAGASADAAYDGGVAIFTLPLGGLMVEASVGGQKFAYEAR